LLQSPQAPSNMAYMGCETTRNKLLWFLFGLFTGLGTLFFILGIIFLNFVIGIVLLIFGILLCVASSLCLYFMCCCINPPGTVRPARTTLCMCVAYKRVVDTA
jgi:hypothetical protein